jgi:hypothetical protein
MKSNASTAEKPAARLEARAKQHCHDAMYLGTDGDRAVHFWSRHDQTAIVFDDATDHEPELIAIPTDMRSTGTHIGELGDWAAYIHRQRGDWQELRMSGSLADQFLAATADDGDVLS